MFCSRLLAPLVSGAIVLGGFAAPAAGASPATPHGPPPAGGNQRIESSPDSVSGRAVADGARDAVPAAAPVSPRRSWPWGWRVGAGGTAFTGALADSSDGAVVSFDAGVFASIETGWLAVEPQVIVAMRGGNFVDPYFGTVFDEFGDPYVVKVGEIDGTLSMFEIRAPLLARLRVAPWHFEPHVLGGLVPALLVHGSYSGNRILRDFWPESFRRTSLGWAAGAGTRWPTRHGALTIDFRYEESGDDLFRSRRGLPGRMRAWILGFGLRLKGPSGSTR